jgi:hypothetical protein
MRAKGFGIYLISCLALVNRKVWASTGLFFP